MLSNKEQQKETNNLLGMIEKHGCYTNNGDSCVEIGSRVSPQKDLNIDAANETPAQPPRIGSRLFLFAILLCFVLLLNTIFTKLSNTGMSYQSWMAMRAKINFFSKSKKNDSQSEIIDASPTSSEVCHKELTLCEAFVNSKEESERQLELELYKCRSDLRKEREKIPYLGSLHSDEEDSSQAADRDEEPRDDSMSLLELELNETISDLHSEREKVANLSKTIETLQDLVRQARTKSDDLIGLMKAQVEEVQKINKRPPYKAFSSSTELERAVDDYLSESNQRISSVAQLYGYPINKWDVSQVTSFYRLFSTLRSDKAAEINEDLSEWDVSGGKNFADMFNRASKFNGNLSAWNTSSAEKTYGMFCMSTSFNSDLSKWDVSHITHMGWMFYNATSFHSDLRGWEIGVTNVNTMFGPNLGRFRYQVKSWDLAKATDWETMFDAHK